MQKRKAIMTGVRIAGFVGEHLRFFDAYSSVRRALTRSEIVILLYHNVSSENYPWLREAVKPEDFDRQVAYLGKVAEIVPLEQLLNRLGQGEMVHPRTVSITFDDGYRDNYTYAYPILRKYNVPATILLTTGYIGGCGVWPCHKARFAIWNTQVSEFEVEGLGHYHLKSSGDKLSAMQKIELTLESMPERKKNLSVEGLLKELGVSFPVGSLPRLVLSWEEILEMSKNGISFGAHTVTHTMLTRLPVEEAKGEITRCKKEIEEKLGQECTIFSYPDGKFNDGIIELVKEAGLKYALTTVPGMITGKSDPFMLNRIHGGRDFYTFKALLSGIFPDIMSVLNPGKDRSSHRAQ